MNFGYVTVNGVNSNDYCEFFMNKLVFKCAKCYNILENDVTARLLNSYKMIIKHTKRRHPIV